MYDLRAYATFALDTFACLQAEQFSYCQPWMLAWGYRKQNLIAELVAYNADVMCLQVCSP